MSIATLLLIPCELAELACNRHDLIIWPKSQLFSLPFWTGAGILSVIALLLLAIIGGRHTRMVIIMTLATPAIFIVGKLMIAGVYFCALIMNYSGQNTRSKS